MQFLQNWIFGSSVKSWEIKFLFFSLTQSYLFLIKIHCCVQILSFNSKDLYDSKIKVFHSKKCVVHFSLKKKEWEMKILTFLRDICSRVFSDKWSTYEKKNSSTKKITFKGCKMLNGMMIYRSFQITWYIFIHTS